MQRICASLAPNQPDTSGQLHYMPGSAGRSRVCYVQCKRCGARVHRHCDSGGGAGDILTADQVGRDQRGWGAVQLVALAAGGQHCPAYLPCAMAAHADLRRRRGAVQHLPDL
eukprot:350255-Chlamydomonas_euryale.AAC.12